jgi:serine/threonine protein phosphatase PrpC/serine/threonine protein kinase
VGIIHRDVKLSNVLLNTEAEPRLILADFSSAVSDPALRLGLFGETGPSRQELTEDYEAPEVRLQGYLSKEDIEESGGMYSFDPLNPAAYDSWTVGVLMLEMILGTPHVFEVDQRAAALLHQRLQKKRLSETEFARTFRTIVFLTALSEYCIFDPSQHLDSTLDRKFSDDKTLQPLIDAIRGNFDTKNKYFARNSLTKEKVKTAAVPTEERSYSTELTAADSVPSVDDRGSLFAYTHAIATDICDSIQPIMSARTPTRSSVGTAENFADSRTTGSFCSVDNFRTAILRRDSLGLGFSDPWGLDLLRRLLHWEPRHRMSMKDAMKHAYFTGPYMSFVDGSEHATEYDMLRHNDEIASAGYVAAVDYDTEPTNDNVIWVSDDESDDNEPSDSSLHEFVITEETMDTRRPDEQVISHPFTIDMKLFEYSTEYSVLNDKNDHEIMHPPVESTVSTDPTSDSLYRCPKCNRTFSTWDGCIMHTRGRKHARRCTFPLAGKDAPPKCVTHYALHPLDPHSGWCDLQGRRRHIEDVHSTAYSESYLYFGVFDGHFGSGTARLAARYLHKRIEQNMARILRSNQLPFRAEEALEQEEKIAILEDEIDDEFVCPPQEPETSDQSSANADSCAAPAYALNMSSEQALLPSGNFKVTSSEINNLDRQLEDLNPSLNVSQFMEIAEGNDVIIGSTTTGSLSVDDFREAIIKSFFDIDNELSPIDSSGAALAILYVFEEFLVVANLGDCRVILCCAPGTDSPVQLTLDHTPYDVKERARIITRGGFIAQSGGVVAERGLDRVNGILAVTRSLGDKSLKHVVSSTPDVLVVRRKLLRNASLNSINSASAPDTSARNSQTYCHYYNRALQAIMGADVSDGLWQLFAIVASDGFWDVITNSEATELACEYLLSEIQAAVHKGRCDAADRTEEPLDWMTFPTESYAVAHMLDDYTFPVKKFDGVHEAYCRQQHSTSRQPQFKIPPNAFQNAAMLLAQEAWLRGSTDNIGVNIVNLIILGQ